MGNFRCQFRQTESGGSRFCQNGRVLAAYMTSHPRRHSSSNINVARCEHDVEAYQQEFVCSVSAMIIENHFIIVSVSAYEPGLPLNAFQT
jgi:hypothetical protein